MPDPAENAATDVALDALDGLADMFGFNKTPINMLRQEIDALLAKAEAAERERNFWERNYKQEHRTRHAMEDTIAELRAERDAAVLAMERRMSELLDHADESDGTGEHVGFARHYRAKAEGMAEALKLLDGGEE